MLVEGRERSVQETKLAIKDIVGKNADSYLVIFAGKNLNALNNKKNACFRAIDALELLRGLENVTSLWGENDHDAKQYLWNMLVWSLYGVTQL